MCNAQGLWVNTGTIQTQAPAPPPTATAQGGTASSDGNRGSPLLLPFLILVAAAVAAAG